MSPEFHASLVVSCTDDQKSMMHAPRWQEVRPDVDGFVVDVEAAEHAVQCRALRVSVAGQDAVLAEHLRNKGRCHRYRLRTIPGFCRNWLLPTKMVAFLFKF